MLIVCVLCEETRGFSGQIIIYNRARPTLPPGFFESTQPMYHVRCCLKKHKLYKRRHPCFCCFISLSISYSILIPKVQLTTILLTITLVVQVEIGCEICIQFGTYDTNWHGNS